MNPFEVTRDPDGGLPTVHVKRGYVVLTKKQDERAAERIAEILAENEKLRKLAIRMWPFAKAYLNMLPMLGIPDSESYDIEIELQKLGIEV